MLITDQPLFTMAQHITPHKTITIHNNMLQPIVLKMACTILKLKPVLVDGKEWSTKQLFLNKSTEPPMGGFLLPDLLVIIICMSDIEFFAKVNPQRLTSLDEDFKAWRKEIQEDDKRNALRRAGKLKPEPVETTYERFPEET
jgi:hypothetical protein